MVGEEYRTKLGPLSRKNAEFSENGGGRVGALF